MAASFALTAAGRRVSTDGGFGFGVFETDGSDPSPEASQMGNSGVPKILLSNGGAKFRGSIVCADMLLNPNFRVVIQNRRTVPTEYSAGTPIVFGRDGKAEVTTEGFVDCTNPA
jgi:hypothetical protein